MTTDIHTAGNAGGTVSRTRMELQNTGETPKQRGTESSDSGLRGGSKVTFIGGEDLDGHQRGSTGRHEE